VNGGFRTNFTPVHDHSVRYMIAVYSYNPVELSPNVDADVSDFAFFALHSYGRLTYVVRPLFFTAIFLHISL